MPLNSKLSSVVKLKIHGADLTISLSTNELSRVFICKNSFLCSKVKKFFFKNHTIKPSETERTSLQPVQTRISDQQKTLELERPRSDSNVPLMPTNSSLPSPASFQVWSQQWSSSLCALWL